MTSVILIFKDVNIMTGSVGYGIKRTADAIDGVGGINELNITGGAVTTAGLSGGAVRIDKLETTRIINGMMVYPSGTDLWIKMSGGTVMITGAGTTYSPAPVAADGYGLVTVATTGCEKVAIAETSGDGVIYIKYGTQVTLNANTSVYPEADTGCIKLANLFYPVSGSTSKHPIYEDEDIADQVDNFGLESSNDVKRFG